MKITCEMTINQVLAIDEDQMLKTLTWLAPEIERLQSPHPLRAVVGTVTVRQVARISRTSLQEVLYALNLAAGVPHEVLAKELSSEFPL